MNLILNNILVPIEKDGTEEYINLASKELGVEASDIVIARILSKSLELGNKEQFYYKLTLVVRVSGSMKETHNYPEYIEKQQT